MDFRAYAAETDAKLDLLQGALLVARDEYPGLNVAAQIRRVDALAAPMVARRLGTLRLVERAAVVGRYLFEDCGFRGNGEDYYDPRNSFVNNVLDRRLGIPLSLSIVYIEVMKRAGVRAHGVGFPGHFLVRLDDPLHNEALLVDPFAAGEVLDRKGLEDLLERATGAPKKLDATMLMPCTPRQMIARMLMNLRGIYAARADYPRLLLVLDRMIDLLAELEYEVRDRGLLWAKLGAPQAAIGDLRRYVEALPHAGDVAEVRRLIAQLERSSVVPN